MKKRLTAALAAGVLAAAMLPGVTSAQGLVEYALLCKGGAIRLSAQEPDASPVDFFAELREELGNGGWGLLMKPANGPDGICRTLDEDTD